MEKKSTTDGNCIFCKIVDRKIPAHTVFENERFLAFLSIDPIAPGHTLVIPKDHYRWVWDVPTIAEYFEVTQKIAIAIRMAFNVDMVESKIIGEEVPHAHIWLFPAPKTPGDKKDFTGNAEKIKNALKA